MVLLICIISCDIMKMRVQSVGQICVNWNTFFIIYCISNMYRDIKILSECTLLLMCEYLLIVNVNKCKKYCVLLCCFI